MFEDDRTCCDGDLTKGNDGAGMRGVWLSVLIGVGCAMGPSATQARDKDQRTDEVRRTVIDYATCVVKRSHDEAAKALLSDANDHEIEHHFSTLIDSDCVQSGIQWIGFSADLFRYALANALVATEFDRGGPDDFADRPPLTHRPAPTSAEIDATLAGVTSAKKREEALKGFKEDQAVAALSRYGECVVREDPKDARLWILTKPGTPEEEKQIDALRPSFSTCLDGGTVAFSKSTMRGTVALNYYRLAHAPMQPSPK